MEALPHLAAAGPDLEILESRKMLLFSDPLDMSTRFYTYTMDTGTIILLLPTILPLCHLLSQPSSKFLEEQLLRAPCRFGKAETQGTSRRSF